MPKIGWDMTLSKAPSKYSRFLVVIRVREDIQMLMRAIQQIMSLLRENSVAERSLETKE